MTKDLFVLLLACAGAANADIWHNGDLTTYSQSSWGGDPSFDAGAALLVASYDTVYAGTFGLVSVGSTSRFTMTFSDAASVLPYLPGDRRIRAAQLERLQSDPDGIGRVRWRGPRA